MKITGLAECNARLKELPRKVSVSIVNKGMRAAAKVILQAARSNAPVASGILKKSIRLHKVRTRLKIIRFTVGVGKKWFAGPVFYAGFVEWGHKIGSRRLGGNRKSIAGKYFIQKAYDEKHSEAVEVAEQSIAAGIERAAEGGS